MSWIKCSDRLPREDTDYDILVYCYCGSIHMATYHPPDQKWVMFSVVGNYTDAPVEDFVRITNKFEYLSGWWAHQDGRLHILTHWMHFPNPPEEDNKPKEITRFVLYNG